MDKKHNLTVLRKLVFFSLIMFGFGYLLVPLYYKICEVTGINNFLEPDTVSENTQINFNRDLTLQLDANSRANMEWALVPVTKTIDFHPGELISFEYNLVNLSNKKIVAQAVPSYLPKEFGAYVKKIDCFCFNQQIFEPNETKVLPVTMLVSNDLPKDINFLTLSYTMFEIEGLASKEINEYN